MSGKSNQKASEILCKVPGFNMLFLKVSLILLCFIIYGNTIPNHYSLDDELVSYHNKRIEQGVKAIPAIWSTFYSEGQLRYEYRPVVKTTFALEYQFFGQNPHVSHFINILLYAITVLLLFKILLKLFSSYSPLLAFATMVLFVVHPVHSEVIASLKNRDEMLSFLGCVFAIWFMMKYADTTKIKYIIYAFIAYILGYLSKSSAIVFVAVIPLILYFYGKTSIKKIGMVFIIILVAMIAARFIPKAMLPNPNREVFFFENPLFYLHALHFKIPMGFLSLLFYLKILIFPHPLVFYYGYNMIPMVSMTNVFVLISAVIYLALFVFAIIGMKKRTVLSFSILYFLITLSMFSNLFKPAMGIVAERYVYASSLGFCLALAFILLKILKLTTISENIPRKDWIKISIPLLILGIPYSAKTITRNPDWNTHMSLYTHDMKYLERSAKANAMMANQIIGEANDLLNLGIMPENLRQKADSSIMFYQRAIKVMPSYYSSYNNIGNVYINLMVPFENDSAKRNELYNKAIFNFQQAIKWKPKYFDATYNLAFTHERSGHITQAIKYYQKALRIDSTFINAWSNMANIYNDYLDKTDSAILINQKIMKMAPRSDLPYVNIGTYYLMKTDTINAVKYFETASEKVPSNNVVAGLLFNYYKNKNTVKAEKYRKRAGIPALNIK